MRIRTIQPLTVAFASMALAFTSRAYAQQLSEARLQELIRLATSQVAGGQTGLAPLPAQGGNSPTLHLSMDDLTKLTLDKNLSIAVQRLNPQINDIALANLQTFYHPTVTSGLNQQARTTAPTTVLNLSTSSAAPTINTFNYNAGWQQAVQKGGGTFSASLNNFRQTSTSNTVTYDPLFQSAWTFNYTQPLLRNFKIDSNRQQIYVAQVNRDMSDVQLRATIANTLANAQKAYWEYVYATQAVQVAKDSLDIASRLVADNNTRVEVGTMAPLDVLTAKSQEATARQQLVLAQATQRTNEIALKQFIVSGTDDPTWNSTIDATDQPDFNPQPIDLQAALRRALTERTDLTLAKQTVRENDIILRYMNDQLKPQTDLSVNYGTTGIGGTAFTRTNLSNATGSSVTTIPGGITDAYSSLFRNLYPAWTIGVNFSYPLGQSTQEATLARARVQQNQVNAQIKQTELQVATDVTNAWTSANNAAEQAEAARVAVDLARSELDAENSKFDVGMSTNYNVVLAQQTLSNARQTEARAIANYREALVELERLQQTTLTSANITVVGR